MVTHVLVNGNIVTVDDQFSVAEAVAIDGERITAVGPATAVRARAGAGATVTDLRGATVIPGLIDNHNHFVRATEHVEVRLEGVRTRAAALDLLRGRAAGLDPGQWLLTLGGWHEDQWEGDRSHLTLAELNAVTGDCPAFIQAQYDHAFVNSAWLDAMGRPLGGRRSADRPRRRWACRAQPGGGTASRRPPGRGRPCGHGLLQQPRADHGLRPGRGEVGVSDAAYAAVETIGARGDLTLRVCTTLGDSTNNTSASGARALAELITAREPFRGDHWYDQIAVGEIYHAPFHWVPWW